MPIWVAILILIGSIAMIYILSRYRSKTDNTKNYTIVMVLIGTIALVIMGYLLLSVIFLSAVTT